MEVQGGKIDITFKHVSKGLEARDVTLLGGHELSKEMLQGFSICDESRIFVWADAVITAPNQVTVSSPGVTSPVAVRYAWSSFPLCNLYNQDGLPASSFRTDAFEPAGLLRGK
jgi:sialate O-acetylesterase